jgi:hypothetical protein
VAVKITAVDSVIFYRIRSVHMYCHARLV